MGEPLIHTLKFGDVINDDGIYKTPGAFLIVETGILLVQTRRANQACFGVHARCGR